MDVLVTENLFNVTVTTETGVTVVTPISSYNIIPSTVGIQGPLGPVTGGSGGDTGILSGAFYPLNSNPSGYVNSGQTGKFLTHNIGGNSINNNPFVPELYIYQAQNIESQTVGYDGTAPSQGIMFQRFWTATTSGNEAGIYGYGTPNWGGGLIFQTKEGDGNPISSGRTVMILQSDRNVGINVSLASEQLHVSGKIRADQGFVSGETDLSDIFLTSLPTDAGFNNLSINTTLSFSENGPIMSYEEDGGALIINFQRTVDTPITWNFNDNQNMSIGGSLTVGGNAVLTGLPTDPEFNTITTDSDANINGSVNAGGANLGFINLGAGALIGGSINPLAGGGIEFDGYFHFEGETTVNSDLNVNGKITAQGGVDPLYVSFTQTSRSGIRDVIRNGASGIAPITGIHLHDAFTFFNSGSKAVEIYLPMEDAFYNIMGSFIQSGIV